MRSVEAKLFHADGQTDMTKLTVALRNLRTCPQNQSVYVTSSKSHWLFWDTYTIHNAMRALCRIFER